MKKLILTAKQARKLFAAVEPAREKDCAYELHDWTEFIQIQTDIKTEGNYVTATTCDGFGIVKYTVPLDPAWNFTTEPFICLIRPVEIAKHVDLIEIEATEDGAVIRLCSISDAGNPHVEKINIEPPKHEFMYVKFYLSLQSDCEFSFDPKYMIELLTPLKKCKYVTIRHDSKDRLAAIKIIATGTDGDTTDAILCPVRVTQ